jgi:hypothetical protein
MLLQVSRMQGPLDNLCPLQQVTSAFLISEWTSTWGTGFIHHTIHKTNNTDIVKQQFAILRSIQFVPDRVCQLREQMNPMLQ